jgi:hypothetical protein
MPWLASQPNNSEKATGTANRALASLFAANHALIDGSPGTAGTGTPATGTSASGTDAAETGQADRSR